MASTRRGWTPRSQFATGIAAFSLVVCASCLSGLPSAACGGIAQTYISAIGDFGIAALAAALSVFFSDRPYLSRPYVTTTMFLLALFFASSAIMAGNENLERAAGLCWIDSPKRIVADRYQPKALDAFTIWPSLAKRLLGLN